MRNGEQTIRDALKKAQAVLCQCPSSEILRQEAA